MTFLEILIVSKKCSGYQEVMKIVHDLSAGL
jgi:hypothetical protein